MRQWSISIGIDADDAAILVKNKITGADLLDIVTEEKLKELGMPLGPSWRLLSAVAAIKRVTGGSRRLGSTLGSSRLPLFSFGGTAPVDRPPSSRAL